MSREELTTGEKLVLKFIKELHAKNKRVRVLDLIKFVEKGTGLGRREVMEAITGLERKGFIKLADRHDMELKEEREEAKYPREIVELKARIERLKDLVIKMT
jgi:hypothetical protein